MDSPEQIAVNVAIGTGAALLGSLVSWRLTLSLERRKHQVNRTLAAYQSCQELQATLSRWMNEIRDAASEEPTVDDVKRRLRAVYDRQDFESQIGNRLNDLRDEPLCAGLLTRTEIFARQAFEAKGRIAMALVGGDLTRDYPTHRDSALHRLLEVYQDFTGELGRVLPQLKQKALL